MAAPATRHHRRTRRRSSLRGSLWNDNEKSKLKATASEAQYIQQSLKRTQTLLQSELSRVGQIGSAIEQDGKLLETTMDVQKELKDVRADKALKNLQRAQQRERYVLLASVFFFYAVVAYILWCRLVRLPFGFS